MPKVSFPLARRDQTNLLHLRKVGTTENRSDFMSKDRTKKIFNLLEKGKSVRDISGRLGVSTKTVVKVRKYWDSPKKVLVEV